jgi:hypothetical protein
MHVFQVGNHVVRVSEADERWRVSVDDVMVSRWFCTEADAWVAGVREAARLDQEAGTSAVN